MRWFIPFNNNNKGNKLKLLLTFYRFCDSPTEELDSRTPKGRGKRGRSAALTPDLSNFTETRSSVSDDLILNVDLLLSSFKHKF